MQPPDADGAAALLVTDDQHEGAAAVLVAVREDQVVAKRSLVIGMERGRPAPDTGAGRPGSFEGD